MQKRRKICTFFEADSFEALSSVARRFLQMFPHCLLFNSPAGCHSRMCIILHCAAILSQLLNVQFDSLPARLVSKPLHDHLPGHGNCRIISIYNRFSCFPHYTIISLVFQALPSFSSAFRKTPNSSSLFCRGSSLNTKFFHSLLFCQKEHAGGIILTNFQILTAKNRKIAVQRFMPADAPCAS